MTDERSRIADGQNLGMCSGVARELALVVARREQGAVPVDNDGADRHVTVVDSSRRFDESQAHELVVIEDGRFGHRHRGQATTRALGWRIWRRAWDSNPR